MDGAIFLARFDWRYLIVLKYSKTKIEVAWGEKPRKNTEKKYKLKKKT